MRRKSRGVTSGLPGSSVAKARQAFRVGQVLKYTSSSFAYRKTTVGLKTTYIITAGTPSDLASVIEQRPVLGTGATLTNLGCALSNFRQTLYLKNVATYQLRVRVTTWVCRHDVPGASVALNEGGVDAMDTLANMMTAGFAGPFVETPINGVTAETTDISATIFQNPLWVQYFKAVKVRNTVLMPYRTKGFSVGICKRRPGWLQNNGNARVYSSGLDTSDYGFPGHLAVRRWGGVTTRIKTLEIVGEIVNDATAVPNTNIFTSPSVLLSQSKITFTAAFPIYASSVSYTSGDPPLPGGIDEVLVGQPWNYMFPSPSSSSSLGTSSVIGSLTSGI